MNDQAAFLELLHDNENLNLNELPQGLPFGWNIKHFIDLESGTMLKHFSLTC